MADAKTKCESPCAEEPQTFEDLIIDPKKPKVGKRKVPKWNGPEGLFEIKDRTNPRLAENVIRNQYDDWGWSFRPDYKDVEAELTEDVRRYMWEHYKDVGERLRSGRRLTPDQQHTFKAFMDILEPTYEDTLQYRGINLFEKDIDNLRGVKKGDKIDILQPLHTSNDFTWSDEFVSSGFTTLEEGDPIMMQIRVPRGVKSLVTNAGEKEMAIGPGYKLQVIDVIDDFHFVGGEYEAKMGGFLGFGEKTVTQKIERTYKRMILTEVVSEKPLQYKDYPKGYNFKNLLQLETMPAKERAELEEILMELMFGF